MVEVHALDAWILPESRTGAAYGWLRMLGGLAAPSFLFMAGLSQCLADAAGVRRGLSVSARRRAALGRAIWLFGVAYLFRLAEFILGLTFFLPDGWKQLLLVDILNIIAVSLAVTAMVSIGRSPRAHLFAAGIGCVAIAAATPLVAGWQHPPSRVLDYLWAAWPRANFTIFPWMAFALAGSAVGRILTEDSRDRPLGFLGAGGALMALGWLGARAPSPWPAGASTAFWAVAPSWFAVHLGVVISMTGALQALPALADRGLGWLRTLGRHSLLGYMLSVELSYGQLSKPLHGRLSLTGVLLGVVAMLVVTWALSAGRDFWDRRRRTGREER